MKKGFTLIELLIVISIMVILIGLSSVGLQGAFENARDAKRRSELNEYQALLKNYASKNLGYYPCRPNSAVPTETTLCSDLGANNCPADPINTSPFGYRYISNACTAGSASAINYVLYSRFEQTPASYFVVCSNGLSGERATVPLIGDCPIGLPEAAPCTCVCLMGVVQGGSTCGSCGTPSAPACTGPNTCACQPIT
jgi:prepilin-type N-terminal cleavage/methylation domain-containing protein